MGPIAAALAGSGGALATGLVIWPLYVLVANIAVVRVTSLPGAVSEMLWGVLFGTTSGLAAVSIAALASPRAWPRTALGSWLIWACVLAPLIAIGMVPLLFGVAGVLIALGTTVVIAMRVRPRVAPGIVRAMFAGSGGFSVFVGAFVLAIMAASRSRPGGVGPVEWRRYMDGVDMLGAVALALGVGAALALVIFERRTMGVLVALLTFGVLFLGAAPLLGLISACYAGEVVLIVGWLVSPSC
jgi:hypothetical protein